MEGKKRNERERDRKKRERNLGHDERRITKVKVRGKSGREVKMARGEEARGRLQFHEGQVPPSPS